MRIVRSALVFSSLLAAACGSAQATPSTPPVTAAAPVATAAAEPTPAPESATEASKPAPSDTAADSNARPPAIAKGEPNPDATREVTYVVLPEGLKISVAGVRFAVSASAVQVASGWGVKLNVLASAIDGKPHSLASPKTGPLAFAGSVLRKAQSEPEQFGDERAGDGEQVIFGDDPSKFNRNWPAKGARALASGDSLDLQVALWGLGTEKDSRRPVKKFCHVRLQVGKGKPRAILEPPQGLSSK